MDVEDASPAMHTARRRRAALPATLPAALLIAVGLPHASGAQEPAAPPQACTRVAGPDSGAVAAPATQPGGARSTVRLLASVRADEVRFVGSPVVCVRLTGDARLDTVRVVARRNIASPVVSGTSYRDVHVAVEILGRLNAECIAARITGSAAGGAADSTSAGAASRCAALDARGTAGAGRRDP